MNRYESRKAEAEARRAIGERQETRPQHPIGRYLAALVYGQRHVDEAEKIAPAPKRDDAPKPGK